MNKNELNDEIRSAMKSGDTVRRDTLRSVLNEVKNNEIANKSEASDEDVNAAIKKVLKQTNETLEMSIKANNNQERTDNLAAQVAVLESCMPAMLTGDALREEVAAIVSSGGYTSMKDMGKIMGELKAKTGGAFDGSEASSIAKALFA